MFITFGIVDLEVTIQSPKDVVRVMQCSVNAAFPELVTELPNSWPNGQLS